MANAPFQPESLYEGRRFVMEHRARFQEITASLQTYMSLDMVGRLYAESVSDEPTSSWKKRFDAYIERAQETYPDMLSLFQQKGGKLTTSGLITKEEARKLLKYMLDAAE